MEAADGAVDDAKHYIGRGGGGGRNIGGGGGLNGGRIGGNPGLTPGGGGPVVGEQRMLVHRLLLTWKRWTHRWRCTQPSGAVELVERWWRPCQTRLVDSADFVDDELRLVVSEGCEAS